MARQTIFDTAIRCDNMLQVSEVLSQTCNVVVPVFNVTWEIVVPWQTVAAAMLRYVCLISDTGKNSAKNRRLELSREIKIDVTTLKQNGCRKIPEETKTLSIH